MSDTPQHVLDASALIAYLRDEPGARVVEQALGHGARISAANWAETLTKMSDLGYDPDALVSDLSEQGILHQTLTIHPLDHQAALEIARLRPVTRPFGLSLGDRACLALGRILNLPVLTAEHAWATLDLGVQIETIR